MENNENKKTPEVLDDETLGEVTGGGELTDWKIFQHNCMDCCHNPQRNNDCPYGFPLHGFTELKDTSCPSKAQA